MNARTARPTPPGSRGQARAIVREFAGSAQTFELQFDARTAYDFVISLFVGSEREEPEVSPEDRQWLADSLASLPDDVRADLDAVAGEEHGKAYRGLGGLIVDRPEARDAASIVAAVESGAVSDLVRELLVDVFRDPGLAPLAERALKGDRAIVAELSPQLPEWHREGTLELLREPEAGIERLRRALRAWHTPYATIEDRVRLILQRDVAGRATDRRRLEPGELIEQTTGGIRWIPEPQVRRVVLAPSYFARPYNNLFAGSDWRLFCYPVADSALGPATGLEPPPSVVRLYRALGDPTRLRILKLLASKDYYLTELAQQLDLSKPTMKHHLALLRAAGLVTVVEEGTLTYYSLRRERLEEGGSELRSFLH